MKFGFLNSHNVFLMDAVGALLSLILTAGILPFLTPWTGIPTSVLYALAVLPFLYFLFSATCYKLPRRKPWMLLTIILANAFYVLVSGTMILTLDSIEAWGYLFLLAEIIVLLCVIALEWSVYQRASY